MTLAEIELDVFRRLDYADAPPPSVRARINSYINQRHRQILSHDRMRLLRQTTAMLTTVPGQSSYALPDGGARVHRITHLCSHYVLGARTLEWYRDHNPHTETSGTPEVWCPAGTSAAIRRQLDTEASGPGLWVSGISSEAPTTFSVTALLTGGGFHTQSGITLWNDNPLPPSARMPLNSTFFASGVSQVTEFAANAPVTNTVTLWDTSTGGTPLSQINRLQTRAKYYRFVLHPTPASAETFMIDFEREIQDLTAPDDEPLLPTDFHALLAMYGRLDEYEFKSDNRWESLMLQIQSRTRELRAFVDNHDIYREHAVPHTRELFRGPMIGAASAGDGGTGGDIDPDHVSGPATSAPGTVPVYADATGKLITNSLVEILDGQHLIVPGVLQCTGGFVERGRTVPLGEWIVAPFTASDFFADPPMVWTVQAEDLIQYAYTVVGKTMVMTFVVGPTVLSGTATANLHMKIPGGFIGALTILSMATYVRDTTALRGAYTTTGVGSPTLNIARADEVPFALDSNFYVYGTATFPIL